VKREASGKKSLGRERKAKRGLRYKTAFSPIFGEILEARAKKLFFILALFGEGINCPAGFLMGFCGPNLRV
jgi:hypothetical protein